jgi:hypothetical protein
VRPWVPSPALQKRNISDVTNKGNILIESWTGKDVIETIGEVGI